jgi:hypothetical protein
MHRSRITLLVVVFASLLVAAVAASQTPSVNADPDRLTAKSLEAVGTFSQNLSQWCFVIIGATVLCLLEKSGPWGKHRFVRLCYVLFLPAWIGLCSSIYFGTRVQNAYLSYVLVPSNTISDTIAVLNSDLNCQTKSMMWGLMFLALWLVCIWLGWLCAKNQNTSQGQTP